LLFLTNKNTVITLGVLVALGTLVGLSVIPAQHSCRCSQRRLSSSKW